MASIKDLGGNKWKVTISAGFNPDGSRNRFFKTITAKDEEAAQKQANKLEGQVEKGQIDKPTHYTFNQYVDKWKKDVEGGSVKLADKTFFRYKQLLDSRIIPAFGSYKLEKITPSLIDDFYIRLRGQHTFIKISKDGTKSEGTSEGLNENTIKHHHALISSILGRAVKKKVLKDNPCKNADVPTRESADPVEYSEELIPNLLECLEDAELRLKVCVSLAISGGLRTEEIMGLEWPDIDFVNNTIKIERVSQFTPDKGIFTKEPKTKKSKRKITLNSYVMSLLKELENSQRKQSMRLANKWLGRDFKAETRTGRLIVTEEGSPLYPYSPSKWFQQFLRDNSLPHIRFHDLRHIHASYLIFAGLDPATVSKRLGHSNTSTTLNVYTHSFKAKDDEAALATEGMYPSKEKKVSQIK